MRLTLLEAVLLQATPSRSCQTWNGRDSLQKSKQRSCVALAQMSWLRRRRLTVGTLGIEANVIWVYVVLNSVSRIAMKGMRKIWVGSHQVQSTCCYI